MGGLLLASAIATFGGSNFAALAACVAALQSATPATIAAASRQLPGRPALAGGLTLGFAIALGATPFMLGIHVDTPAALIGSAIMLFLAHPRRATPPLPTLTIDGSFS